MPRFSGFAGLREPRDLVTKLRHDLARMVADPGDSYAAFDFFVTAEHILDWLHPGESEKPKRKIARNSKVLLQITSHIANGAKHFVAEAPHLKSVTGIEHQGYADDYVEPGYVGESIVVRLSADEALSLGTTEIDAVALASQVLAFWEGEIR
jgi:hypothetical protein